MNRRDFLKRMALLGLAVPSTRTIIDMGANLWREPKTLTLEWGEGWHPMGAWRHLVYVPTSTQPTVCLEVTNESREAIRQWAQGLGDWEEHFIAPNFLAD